MSDLPPGELVLEPCRPAPPRAIDRIHRRRLTGTYPEPAGRFRRCCPFCTEPQPVTWRLFGDGGDDVEERPFCPEHGPVRYWRIIDFEGVFARAHGPSIVGAGHREKRIAGHLTRFPIPVSKARPAPARWKRALGRVLGTTGCEDGCPGCRGRGIILRKPPAQRNLVPSIELVHLAA